MMAKAIDYFAYDNKLLSLKTFFSMKARTKMFNYFMKTIKPLADNVL